MTTTKTQTMVIIDRKTREELLKIKAYKMQTFNEVIIGLIKINNGKVVIPHD